MDKCATLYELADLAITKGKIGRHVLLVVYNVGTLLRLIIRVLHCMLQLQVPIIMSKTSSRVSTFLGHRTIYILSNSYLYLEQGQFLANTAASATRKWNVTEGDR